MPLDVGFAEPRKEVVEELLAQCKAIVVAAMAPADSSYYRELGLEHVEAKLSHEGDDCTFEVLKRRFALPDVALDAIAEIVHDIDLKDAKFGRPEAPGVAARWRRSSAA